MKQQLLVEGKNDQHVVWAFCQKYQLSENFKVIDCEGIEKLLEQIPARLKQSGLQTLGIILDADSDLQSRYNALKGRLENMDNLPNTLPSTGLIIDHNSIRIGIWIMPNNQVNGILEDFIAFLIPNKDPLLPIAEEVLGRIEQDQLNPYTLAHHAKALIHTWLAWQKVTGSPMGQAITNRYLDTEIEQAQIFLN